MDELQFTPVFSAESGRAQNYRIPAMVTTGQGTVIACCDERFFTGSDNPNRIDKVVRRSLDGGKSWEKQIVAVQEQGTSKEFSSAAIDPALLYDSFNDCVYMLYSHTPAGVGILNAKRGKGVDKDGRILVKDSAGKSYAIDGNNLLFEGKPTGITCDENGNLYRDNNYLCNVYTYDGEYKEHATFYLYLSKSIDDGVSWSKPICLNAQVKEEYMSFLGAGPGVGLCVQQGKYKGRLIFPVYYNAATMPLMLSCCVIYSDDGVNFKRGLSPNNTRRWGPFRLNPRFLPNNFMTTESQLIEAEEGKLRVFMRNHSAKRLLATAESTNGGESFHGFALHSQLPQCICQCSVINASYKGQTVTLLLNAADKRARRNGVIRLSFDYGKTFPHSRVITEGEFVYSSMCQLPNGEIGVLFENSTQHENIQFTTFPIEWIMGGNK